MIPLEITTYLSNGELSASQEFRIKDYLRKLGNSPVHIYIGQKRRPKSHAQRGYYWGVMLKIISDYTGYTEEEAHEEMKQRFLTVRPVLSSGEELEEKVLSTESLNTKETEDFYESIRRFWAMQGVIIPLPNED